MVITVTLNPAVDITAHTDALRTGCLNRLSRSVVNAGGKGVNAAALVKSLGGDVLSAGFVGGATGALYLRLLEETGLLHEFIEIPDETRINTKIIDAEGSMTEFNAPGGAANEEAWRGMEALLLRLCGNGTVFVFSGNLPPGAPAGIYAHYIQMLRKRGARTVLDTSGEALRLGVAAQPDAVKPNREEMADIGGQPVSGWLVESLGAEGARFSHNGKSFFINAPSVEVQSPAGAGDCMTGALAFALDRGLPFEEAAILSAAAAAAAVMTPGTKCPPPALVQACQKQLKLL